MQRLFYTFILMTGLATHAMAFKFFEEHDPAPLPEAGNLSQWFHEGEASLALRVQAVDLGETSVSSEQGAQALTVRTRLGYQSAQWHYLSFALGVDDIRALDGSDNYFDGSNGELDDLFVAAPEGTDVHTALLMADLINTQVRYGRQTLTLDGGRHIGHSSWDQKESTVSGVTLRNASLNVTRFRAGSLHRKHTGIGADQSDEAHSIRARYAHLEYLGIIHSALSAYYLDVDGGASRERWDSRTYGLRFAGDINSDFYLHYLLEYAHQRSAASNPLNYHSDYSAFEFGVGIDGYALIIGQAILGADNDGFFVSPLADLRAHQGWSNLLAGDGLGNLAGGVQDRMVRLDATVSDQLVFTARYHWFEPDDGSTSVRKWGNEINLGAVYERSGISLALYFADFRDKGLGIDAKSSWVNLAYQF